MNKDKMGDWSEASSLLVPATSDATHRGPILSRQKQTVTVTGLRAANFMIDHGCSMIALDGAPETLKEAKMIFRGENVFKTYQKAQICKFSALTSSEYDRILSMVALLACVEDAKAKEREESL